jgi:flagellar export protein FliJ
MKAFRFRVDRVLDWRRTELDLEENRLKQMHAAVAALDRERADLETAAAEARREVAQAETSDALELHALDAYRRAVDLHRLRLADKRRQRQVELAGQQQKLLEARRRCQLLENLRDRRLAEWKYETQRQEEADLPPRAPKL